MKHKLYIRPEQKRDNIQIHCLIQSAFESISYSNQREHFLVDALREAGALYVSLVAELERDIVGHIAFSEVTINHKNCSWFGLAPVSVHPNYQKKGVGSKLILEGLEQINNLGALGCVLLGEPEFYNRFGFKQFSELTLEGVPSEYFLMQSFTDEIPSGFVEYHPIFKEYS